MVKPILIITIPCYNEEEVLQETVDKMTALLDDMIGVQKLVDPASRMLLVNDGSKDKTWSLIEQFHKENTYVCGVNLEGCDIVYGVRKERKTDTWFKRTTALGFYTLMQKLGVKSVYNHADYRLMSKRAVLQLSLYREKNLFLRGIVPLLGYKTDCVYYDRAERFPVLFKPLRRKFGRLLLVFVAQYGLSSLQCVDGVFQFHHSGQILYRTLLRIFSSPGI